jgi:2Fe-2S ferredoxin
MPIITYELPNGTAREVDVPIGQSVMDGAVRNNLPGVVAECGGSCSCATCHVHVVSGGDQFADVTPEERDLLDFLEGVAPSSRLSCQLIITDACDGVRIAVADNEH